MTLLGGCYDLLKERILVHGAPLTFLFLLPWILANDPSRKYEKRLVAVKRSAVSALRMPVIRRNSDYNNKAT